jgi:threonine dehydratase
MTLAVDMGNIVAAAAVIDPVFLDSPLITAPSLDEALGCRILAKVESINPIGSFK